MSNYTAGKVSRAAEASGRGEGGARAGAGAGGAGAGGAAGRGPGGVGKRSLVETALPHRERMEAAFGADFSDVRVRLGAAGELAPLGARALTRGNTIAFAS